MYPNDISSMHNYYLDQIIVCESVVAFLFTGRSVRDSRGETDEDNGYGNW